MEVITIGNHKGGTGKTATSLHIGAVFGLIGYKTLLIDLDPQGFLTRMMGVDTNSVVDTSLRLFDVDTSLAQLETVPLPSFHLLPSSEGMRTREKKLTSTIDLFLVKEALRGQDLYDVIILDTAAALSSYVLNALVTADTLMI
ncbi:MAG: AAA family ATPase, partial [Rhodothermaceae bacterium]|nr:AAA family ATPase [Rhodothermaceae bacterium]